MKPIRKWGCPLCGQGYDSEAEAVSCRCRKILEYYLCPVCGASFFNGEAACAAHIASHFEVAAAASAADIDAAAMTPNAQAKGDGQTSRPVKQRIERTNWKKMEHERPTYRVRRALTRLSRDRWIPGKEVFDLSRRLAMCASPGRASVVANQAMAGECKVIGMLRGHPPAYVWEKDYGAFVAALADKPAGRGGIRELTILNLLLKREREAKNEREQQYC